MYPPATDEHAIGAAVIGKHEGIAPFFNARMVFGHTVTVEDDVVVPGPADGGTFRIQLTLLQQRVAHEYAKIGHATSLIGPGGPDRRAGTPDVRIRYGCSRTKPLPCPSVATVNRELLGHCRYF